jgi:radical SAM superfamily enzyme YgiQ (UPF0313 family)
MKLKIILISPVQNEGIKKPKGVRIPEMALLIIAGLTPEEHEVTIVEEEVEEVSFDVDCDLVAISCMTANAPRAYYFAEQFRKRGKPVVLGGIHPSVLPDEAGQYADSVVIGEAEGVWLDILEDCKQGRLKPRYRKEQPSLDTYIPIKQPEGSKRSLFDVRPIVTTRGCPYNCEFCCVHDIFGRKIRHIPVEHVVRDIIESGKNFFLFLDDNIIGDPAYAEELFTAVKPLGITWSGEASISFVDNKKLLTLAAESGCTALFFGLETVSVPQLKKMRKSFKEIDKVEEAIKKLKDYGIYFHPSMIFGFDDDTPEIFEETLEFLYRNNISSATLNILTPYPGTRLYARFEQEGRLLTHEWKYYDHATAVFHPTHMSARELHEGRLWVKKEFTKFASVLRRLPHHLDKPHYHLALNWGGNRAIRNEIRHLHQRVSALYSDQTPGPFSNNL